MIHLPKSLACRDCKRSFTFTTDERRLFDELGFEDPKRCPRCRRTLEHSRRNFRYGHGLIATRGRISWLDDLRQTA